MDPKAEAERHRRIADLLDEIADKCEPLSTYTAGVYRRNAGLNRSIANKLDPPQPEWQTGDYVRDKNGGVWRHDGSFWRSAGGACALASDLPYLYGPIRKVRIADPAKQEVVVSLDGIDRARLDKWADNAENAYRWPNATITIRAAKAAREQLGEV